MVLNGDRPPSNKKILIALRLRRIVIFVPLFKMTNLPRNEFPAI
jgi:hypothetical protein